MGWVFGYGASDLFGSAARCRITADSAVMMGKPCIAGKRISVELILRNLGAGRSMADVLDEYPQLTDEDVRTAAAFAARG